MDIAAHLGKQLREVHADVGRAVRATGRSSSAREPVTPMLASPSLWKSSSMASITAALRSAAIPATDVRAAPHRRFAMPGSMVHA